MHVYLQVKAAALVEETRIIKHHEKRLLRRLRTRRTLKPEDRGEHFLANQLRDVDQFFGLRRHRLLAVRRAARSTHLALGFLRGREYHHIEHGAYEYPDLNEVWRLVRTYGEGDSRVLMQRFAEWCDDANIYRELLCRRREDIRKGQTQTQAEAKTKTQGPVEAAP